jgi:hypothetical protein
MIDWTLVLSGAIAAIPPTLVAYLGWRSSRTVHKIVNSQRAEMVAEIKALNQVIADLRTKG